MSANLDEVWFLTSELESERASSFRQERWCRIFLEAGARLRLFNLRGAFHYSDEICTNDAELTAFRKNGVANYKGPKTSVREGLLVSVLRLIKHWLLVDLYLPNVIKLFLHLDRLLRQRSAPVVIMASSPPFSTALVGALIKRRHPGKVVLAIDMRDAWALHESLGGFKPLKRALERKVLGCADTVTTVSMGLADGFRQQYGLETGVMYNVATHYLDVPPAERMDLRQVHPAIDPSRITLVYTGSAPEDFYDSASIMGAYRRLRQEQPELAARLQMIFIGACVAVERDARDHGIATPDVIFVSHLPHAVARSVQATASALIFLGYRGPNNGGVVSTKLFEYLCLGQPVLPFDLCKDSDVDQLLWRYCGTSINAHGVEATLALFKRVAQEGTGFLPRLDDAQRVRELVDEYRAHAKKLLAG